jgi:hypothetical protein
MKACLIALGLLAIGCHADEARRVEAARTGCPIGAVDAEPSCEGDYFLVTNRCTGEQYHYGCELVLPWLESDCMRGVPLCAYRADHQSER